MKIAHGDTALHVASHTCFPTVEGIEINYTAGYAPGGTEMRGCLVLSIEEAVLIAACVEDVLLCLRQREGELPIGAPDLIEHIAAQARAEERA